MLDDSPEGLTRFKWLMIRRWYRLNTTKGKGAWDKFQENLGAFFQVSSPSREPWMYLIFPATCYNICIVLPSSTEPWCTEFVLEMDTCACGAYMSDLSYSDSSPPSTFLPSPPEKTGVYHRLHCQNKFICSNWYRLAQGLRHTHLYHAVRIFQGSLIIS